MFNRFIITFILFCLTICSYANENNVKIIQYLDAEK